MALAGRGSGGARRGEGAHRDGTAVAGSSLLGLLQESGSKGATGRRLSRRAREARLAPGAGIGGVRKLGIQYRSTLDLRIRGGRPLPAAGSGAAPSPDGAVHLRSARPSSALVRVPAGRLEWVERGSRGEEAAARQFLSSAGRSPRRAAGLGGGFGSRTQVGVRTLAGRGPALQLTTPGNVPARAGSGCAARSLTRPASALLAGKSLKTLMSKGILQVHPPICDCPGCRISSPVVREKWGLPGLWNLCVCCGIGGITSGLPLCRREPPPPGQIGGGNLGHLEPTLSPREPWSCFSRSPPPWSHGSWGLCPVAMLGCHHVVQPR